MGEKYYQYEELFHLFSDGGQEQERLNTMVLEGEDSMENSKARAACSVSCFRGRGKH